MKTFAIHYWLGQALRVTQPLALVLYEKVLPGSQLVNRLQDLNYRVQTLSERGRLIQVAEEAKPMLVLVDLEPGSQEVCAAVARLKQDPKTKHLPVIAFGAEDAPEMREAAQKAGATLVVSPTALLAHLPQFLDQALQVD